MLKITAEIAAKLYLALLRGYDADPDNCYCDHSGEEYDGETYWCVDCQVRAVLNEADGGNREPAKDKDTDAASGS